MDTKREEILQQLWEAQNHAYLLMAEYDSLPHYYGNNILYQAEGDLIGLIGSNPGITVTDLGRILNRTPSACSQLVRKLRGKGLVEQSRNEDNNRLFNLSLTEHGRQIYEDRLTFNEFCQKNTFAMLEKFTAEELLHHLRVQQALNDAYQQDIRYSREQFQKRKP